MTLLAFFLLMIELFWFGALNSSGNSNSPMFQTDSQVSLLLPFNSSSSQELQENCKPKKLLQVAPLGLALMKKISCCGATNKRSIGSVQGGNQDRCAC